MTFGALSMTISVVTIVRDRPLQLSNMLVSLAAGDRRPDEIIVVDLGSAEPVTAETVSAAHRGLSGTGTRPIVVEVVRLDPTDRLPLAAGRNRGAEQASGDRLVFLDVDCMAGPDLISSYASTPPGVLACGPVRYLEAGWEAAADPPDAVELDRHSEPHPIRPIPDDDVLVIDDRYELFWSLSFGIDRSTWDRIGGFDEDFVGYGGEDTDFAFTARALDVPLAWLPTGTAYHQWHRSSDPPVGHLDDIVVNANRFRSKWGVWPMEGWLSDFADLGLVHWSEHRLVALD